VACCDRRFDDDGDITQLVMADGSIYEIDLELLEDTIGDVGTVH